MEIAALIRIASQQHHCITTEQALSVMTPDQFKHLIRSSVLQRCHPRTFVLNGSPNTWLQRVSAATLSVRGSALSHRAAAKFHGLTFVQSNQIEITVRGTYQCARKGVLVHRSGQLGGFVEKIDGIPVTTPERTIVDVSRYLSWRQVGAVIDQARILKLTPAKSIDECIDVMSTRGYRRVASLRTALELRLGSDKDIDSFLEKRTLGWIRSNGLPEPETQFRFRECSRPYRLDVWYPDRRINVEPRGPHHLLPHYALDDAKRDAELSTRGVLVIGVPLEMEEHDFVRLLKEALIARPLSA